MKDTLVKDKNGQGTNISGKGSLQLTGLDCAQCANLIEQRVQKLNGVKSASLDFISGKLAIEAHNKEALPNLLKQAEKVVYTAEPNAKVQERQDSKPQKDKREQIARILQYIGAGLFVLGLAVTLPLLFQLVTFLAAYLLIGWQVIVQAVKNIAKGQVFDENFLMSIATIGAFAIGQYPEGVAVMLFYQVGEGFQELAVTRSKRSIADLMGLRPDYATLYAQGVEQRVAPEQVSVGDIIVVKPGERVPLDGIVTQGVSSLDTAALTGESLPQDVSTGSEVLSGSVNINGLLQIKVSKPFAQSTATQILELVQNSGAKKASSENFITKFAKYYTPFVVFSALLLAILPPLFAGGGYALWLRRALVFLVVSCPCALVLSIPLSYFGGIGGAAKVGILIKGSNYLEALNKVDIVVLDKTGTLTKGVFTLKEIQPEQDFSKEQLLYYAAMAERNSSHPIANCISEAYGRQLNGRAVTEYKEIAGQGIKAVIDNKVVLVGNGKLMRSYNIPINEIASADTIAHIGIGGRYAGYFSIGDKIKATSYKAITELQAQGIRVAMLTGDNELAAKSVAEQLGIQEYYAQLLPAQKIEQLESIAKSAKSKTVFVGDGINDAPVLARADIGIAMGGVGSDAALEAADMVLMTDDLSKIGVSLKIAKRTRFIVIQNIAFSLLVKGVILVLGALGLVSMWGAVFGDVGVSIIAVLNAVRAMKRKDK